ncbi:sensor histidine kinase [Nocardioides currus]|uniref:histidine kinase n=1 Tax=Nocardioides currus TaxID=2133958 RepID=A0A2R7YTR5_9ACTN|nr:HAMP domain-containing sensor histidine kinase [Nocardioides currus]PUA79456.1 hypothetical protein C7S10_18970 [Nocardioides currus]
MRARLALAFACFVLVMTSLGGFIRAQALADAERNHQTTVLTQAARFVAATVEEQHLRGEETDVVDLDRFVPDETELTVTVGDRPDVTVADPEFDADPDDDQLRVQETDGSTRVTITQDASVLEEARRRALNPLFALLVVLVLVAGAVGFVVASLLARPFDRLAESAAALGRGRFDIEPSRSRIPEVVSISTSLEKSAAQLQDSLRRDREFFHHASHVLRTPLTGMRLELEELAQRPELGAEAHGLVDRAVAHAGRLESTVTELLDFARARTLVAGAEVSLLELGSGVAQRWRDRLPDSRAVKAYVDSGPDVTLTPGPVEQLLDSVLRDVADHGSGPVTLRFVGREEHVKVTVSSGPDLTDPADQGAATIAEVLGGRCSRDQASGDLEILLPRR